MSQLSEIEKNRYSRHLALDGFGEQGQENLKRSSVLVIGSGGLGSPVLLYLAAAGVGNIIIIDDDFIDESNLQRQVMFNSDSVGMKKAEQSKARLEQLNPFVKVKALTERFTVYNARDLVKNVDLVIDGSDNFQTRYLVNDACILENKPWVFGSIFKWKGTVSVFNLNNGPSYRCVFPEAPENIPSCSEAGVLGSLTGVTGSLMANEAIKVLSGCGEPLSGKMLSIDLFNNSFELFTLLPDPDQKNVSTLKSNSFACSPSSVQTIKDLDNFLQSHDVTLIDVREPHEIRNELSCTFINIPMSDFKSRMNQVDKHKPVLVVCESGMRSARACEVLVEDNFPSQVFNLDGGMRVYRQQQIHE